MIVGYTRPLFKGDDTSTDNQELRVAGVEKIITERDHRARVHLAITLADAHSGDTLTVTSLERLGASVTLVIGTLLELRARDVKFRCLATPALDSPRDNGDVLNTLRALNAVHRNEVSRRTRAGMVGRPAGRPRALTPEDVAIAIELRRNGRSFARIGQVLGVSTSAVHTALRGATSDQ